MSIKSSSENSIKRTILFGVIGAAIPVAIVYLGFAAFFLGHYLPNTYIGEEDVSRKKVGEVIEAHESAAEDYSLVLVGRDDEEVTVSGEEIGYTYTDSGEEKEILKSQNAFTWVYALSKKHQYSLEHSTAYDESKLEQVLKGSRLFDENYYDPPESAYINITDEGYEIVAEKEGNELIFENTLSEVLQAVDSAASRLLIKDDCYMEPEIRTDSESIQNIAGMLDKYASMTIRYKIEGEDEALSGGDILKLFDIDLSKATIKLDEDKVGEYVQQLAYKYNTFGDERTIKTQKGGRIKIGGGDYGWVIDKTREKEQLIKDIVSKESIDREPVYEQRAVVSGKDDIGDTYVEIDYTNQHLYYIKDGKKKYDTDIVSGNVSRGNGSPDGVFKIVYKQSPATLVGEDYSSDVTYFMPFAYNVGIHDAPWRGQFGGGIYLSSGSHGCINVPAEAAKKLYELLKEGTPVVAYYREPVTLTAENARISNAYSYKKD